MEGNTFRHSILKHSDFISESITRALSDIGTIADVENFDDAELTLLINNYVMNIYFRYFESYGANTDDGLSILKISNDSMCEMWKRRSKSITKKNT